MLERVAEGLTDLVFEWLEDANPVDATTGGATLIEWCAYYGDVSAIRHLLAHGASLSSLGHNYDLAGAAFHGHWRLVEFLAEQGADVNDASGPARESPLHCALVRPGTTTERVVSVLLRAGAEPNVTMEPGVETGAFMRDSRTRGETPLHRAAAFGSLASIVELIEAGAHREIRDVNGDTPLTWASWYRRDTPVLRALSFGEHRVHPDRESMEVYLVGRPVD